MTDPSFLEARDNPYFEITMTRQEILDFVSKKLLDQGKQCLDADGKCSYSDGKGSRCAIGWLVPDEHIELFGTFNNTAIDTLVKQNYIKVNKRDYGFLQELQCAHDSAETWPYALEAAFEEMACTYHVEYKAYAHDERIRLHLETIEVLQKIESPDKITTGIECSEDGLTWKPLEACEAPFLRIKASKQPLLPGVIPYGSTLITPRGSRWALIGYKNQEVYLKNAVCNHTDQLANLVDWKYAEPGSNETRPCHS